MFNIILYNTIDETNKVTKKLMDALKIVGALRNETDVVHPIVLVEGDFIADFNYCYIEEFHRYYYVRDMKSIRNKLIELNLEVDVLMSYDKQIRNTPAIIDKQSSLSEANMYIDDGDWVVQNNEWIQILDFPNGFNNEGEFILIAAGGGVNSL